MTQPYHREFVAPSARRGSRHGMPLRPAAEPRRCAHSVMIDDEMWLEPGFRIEGYEILRKLPRAGFGILYLARDLDRGRDVELEFLRPQHLAHPELVERFVDEARAAAVLEHPGIATV